MVDFSKIKTYPIEERKNKASIKDFVKVESIGKTELNFPEIFCGADIKEFVARVVKAHKAGKKIALMMGAHVIKCGLSLLLIDLMKKGILNHICFNGAGSIHDFEIALIGQTSEDVASGLEDGTFGMADETGRMMCNALKAEYKSATDNSKVDESEAVIGYGHIIGKLIDEQNLPHKEYSILWNAYKLGVPVTVHAAVGTEIIHQHPACDGASLGWATYNDFKIYTDTLAGLEGGVIINLGSAVILPEVFLKALTVARNLGYKVENFTAANIDMIYHYRPRVNVVMRPTSKGGRGFNFIGMHEIMVPLLYSMIISGLSE